MATIETQTYPMCNYSTSKLIVVLRDHSVNIDSGRRDAPAIYPFTMAELQQIANTSTIIQNGWLRPTEKQAEYIYTALRINNWQSILTDEEIEDILQHPTVEGLTKLISIKDALYFERIYGVFIGLKNANIPIANNIERLIKGRYKEFQRGKINTEFTIQEKDIPTTSRTASSAVSQKFEELNDKINEQNNLIEKLMAELNKVQGHTDSDKTPVKTVKRKPTTKKKAEE